MKMTPNEIVKMCSAHYNDWKNEALNSETKEEMLKYLNKSFFWLELQSNLLVLWTVENSFKDDRKIQQKVAAAEANLNKKIVDYIDSVFKDLR
jgi:hypothetical protein